MQRHDTYSILGIAFFYVGRYGGYFVEKYGSRFLDTTILACVFLFLLLSSGKV
jgi:hypothetical protein